MDTDRQNAYQTLLTQALYHVRVDLACMLGGASWLKPWDLIHQLNAAKRAAIRAYTFHNLAFFSINQFEGFEEDRFWQDIKSFERDFPNEEGRYQSVFDKCLSKQEINLLTG